MATKREFEKELSRYGGTHEEPVSPAWHLQPWTMNIDAPKGYVWACDEVHCRVAVGITKAELWDDALIALQYGIEPCTDLGCDCRE